jgi:hypothetical protein
VRPVGIKKLSGLIEQIATAKKDVAELDRMEKAAHADLSIVAASNVGLETARKKITDAKLTLDFVNARRKKASEPVDRLLAELKQELKSAIAVWNGIIGACREGIEKSIVAANLPFFMGDARDCRRVLDSGAMSQMPIFAIYRDAVYDDHNFARVADDELVLRTERFIRHVARHATKAGIHDNLLDVQPSAPAASQGK